MCEMGRLFDDCQIIPTKIVAVWYRINNELGENRKRAEANKRICRVGINMEQGKTG